ncbi:hypothetical protein [uncultured Robinsoniella sp.]|uniref:hypothetical protein n=1 Tax=uncultured Robinsoniella sp. TaxID=904190 RepID=UPI00374FAA85
MSDKKGFFIFFLIVVVVWGQKVLPAQAVKYPDIQNVRRVTNEPIQNSRTDTLASMVSGSAKSYRLALSPYMDPVITLKDSAMEQVKLPVEVKVLLYESNESENGDFSRLPINESIPVVWSQESFQKGQAGGQDFILKGDFVFTDGQKAVIENWEEIKPELSVRISNIANAKRLKVKWNQKRLIINYDKPWGAGQLWLEYSKDLADWTSCDVTDSLTNDYYDVGTCMLYVPEVGTYYVRIKIIDFVYEGYTDIWKAEYATGICSRYQPSESVNPPGADESTGNNTSDDSSSGSNTEIETESSEAELGDGGSGGDRGGGGTKEPDRRPNTPSKGDSNTSGSGNKQKPDKGKGSGGSKGSEAASEDKDGHLTGSGQTGTKGMGADGSGADSMGSDGSGADGMGADGSGSNGSGANGMGSDGTGTNGMQPDSSGTGGLGTDGIQTGGRVVDGLEMSGADMNSHKDENTAHGKSSNNSNERSSANYAAPGVDEEEKEDVEAENLDGTTGLTEGVSDKKSAAAGYTEVKQRKREESLDKKIATAVFCLLAGSGGVCYFRRRN